MKKEKRVFTMAKDKVHTKVPTTERATDNDSIHILFLPIFWSYTGRLKSTFNAVPQP